MCFSMLYVIGAQYLARSIDDVEEVMNCFILLHFVADLGT
jgi:hypothetical protein